MTIRPVIFTRRAEADLARQFEYLLPRAGEETSRQFIVRIIDHCDTFETYPIRGMSRDDIRQGLRIVGYRRPASIAFTVTDDTVIIMRIFMRGMNFGDPADFES